MTLLFTPEQSREIDDRIVEMIAAAFGEGPTTRRARAIANERWLNYPPETSEQDLQPLPPEGRGHPADHMIATNEVCRIAEDARSAIAAGMTLTMRQAIAAIRYSADPADRFRRLPRTDCEIAHELSQAADALRSRQQSAPSAEAAS